MPKNIVICSDGTGQSGIKDTNVSRLFALLDLSDPSTQVACYDAGVGAAPDPALSKAVTRHDPGALKVVIRKSVRLGSAGRFAGLAVGYGLFENVSELYQVLVEHYTPGDRLYFFGFSRGAFTVRVLAGLIYRCGILQPEHRDRFDEAFALYEPHYEALSPSALQKLRADVAQFRTSFTRTCHEITFLGIWDTVKSVGYLWPRSLPHTRRNPLVKMVRHALSLGERRSFFIPTTWGGRDADSEPAIPGQDVQEVWFPGGHSDVGGGYDESDSQLALRPLEWMTREATNCQLRFVEARAGELFGRLSSATAKPHNELLKRSWRLTEFLPRWELVNEPPPPRRVFRWGSTGVRTVAETIRNGLVLIDTSARDEYKYLSNSELRDGAATGRVRFIDTGASHMVAWGGLTSR